MMNDGIWIKIRNLRKRRENRDSIDGKMIEITKRIDEWWDLGDFGGFWKKRRSVCQCGLNANNNNNITTIIMSMKDIFIFEEKFSII